MSKPTKPTPPREPKAPERVYRETYQESVTAYDGMSLTTLLAEVKKVSEGSFPGGPGETSRVKSGMPTFDRLTFSATHSYHDGAEMEVRWPAAIIVTRSDEAMANLMAKFDADMVTYYTKLAAYQAALTQYETDLAKWEAAKVVDAAAKRRAQYEALKGEFGEG